MFSIDESEKKDKYLKDMGCGILKTRIAHTFLIHVYLSFYF